MVPRIPSEGHTEVEVDCEIPCFCIEDGKRLYRVLYRDEEDVTKEEDQPALILITEVENQLE